MNLEYSMVSFFFSHPGEFKRDFERILKHLSYGVVILKREAKEASASLTTNTSETGQICTQNEHLPTIFLSELTW